MKCTQENRQRGPDLRKSSAFLCIINDFGKIFEAKYGTLTLDWHRMDHDRQHYRVPEWKDGTLLEEK